LERAAEELVGRLEQVPPAFSAVKLGGKRAYAAAREGETPVLAPREVEVHSLEILGLHLPEIEFRVRVSTGTYVRSLARDLGRSLGCGAHLNSLRRVAIGPFRVEEAASLEQLESGSLPATSRLTAARAIDWLPHRHLTPAESESIRHGRPIPADGDEAVGGPVALLDGESLMAIGRTESDMLRPEKVFPND
jgi:tRNA pseudouridine55 synthase